MASCRNCIYCGVGVFGELYCLVKHRRVHGHEAMLCERYAPKIFRFI